ncbi:hypothetical protein IAG25_40100 [Caballeronia sp. EK]|uniref:hypothetical protein n=1 Tax=Caballeronia sp. EK TaxID=2767469 RepID=UPI001654DE49|nr:hypothetical protein [Caballeronia sp. EK]MBC8642964.1 hypothetical protein [Caballeronia sp. EK]
MSKAIIDTKGRYDKHGEIRYMTRSGEYVMCRRPRCMPFVLSEKDWNTLPNQPESSASSKEGGGI